MHSNNHISISEAEVHVWRVNLARPRPAGHLLSVDERARAGRFHFERHRHRYTAGRSMLRRILGRYVDTSPNTLRFEYGANGKPGFGTGPIRFNVSHSGDLALIAIASGREIGVDVERIRRDDDLLDVAERYFAPQERVALRSLPEQERCSGFFRCWTRKEAYLKARGEGLSIDLHGFVVSLRPNEPPALLESVSGPAEVLRWTLADLHPHPDYAAALAVEGNECNVRLWQEEAAA